MKPILATRSDHSAASSLLEKRVINLTFGKHHRIGFSRTADITARVTARADLA
jgi:hypothetical protein